ncbi:7-deoxyloganetic acid glucosyltransferase-like [Silene latifolia]|uniref:7-deoxyloganetic acid glucosyltransferase-like n=1 Tax=Silene latifolia TaxID=37657 RepID=UPI003D77D46E
MQNHVQDAPIPHVLIFPLPIQGPVNSMLKLAELLIFATNDIHVTFLTTDHVYNRLQVSAPTTTCFHRHPRLSVHTFSDGLPEGHIRGGDKFLEMMDAVKDVSRSLIKEMLVSNVSSNAINVQNLKHPFTCMIADGLYDFAVDVGNQAGIPVLYFDTISPCCLWVCMCLPRLIDAGHVPIRDMQDLNALVDVVPGMEAFLRRCDLPDMCRGRDDMDLINMQRILAQVKQFQRAQGIILNTFHDLEPTLLSHISSHCLSQVYTLGPLHFLLQRKMEICSLQDSLVTSICSNSFWKEDKSCMAWLDRQQPRSVIYCSFGSQVVMTKEQLIEFWHGLVNSGSTFLWVKRPGSVIGMDDDFRKWNKEMDTGLINEIERKGLIVSWAPQEEVLSHSAIGGFLTHSGWNSTIESITNGVPMICWPHYVDQLVNSRVVSEVWKLGFDIKDTCDRVTIEKMVKDVMNLRKNEFLDNATRLANLAKRSVDEGGSSYLSLDCLIEDIRSLKMLMPNSSL